VAELRRKEQRLEQGPVKLTRKGETRADFLAAVEALKSQDMETTLQAMLDNQPQVLGRLLRLIVKLASIVVQAAGRGKNGQGVLKAYEFTDDFATLVGSVPYDKRSWAGYSPGWAMTAYALPHNFSRRCHCRSTSACNLSIM
jgi:hypothetical protein